MNKGLEVTQSVEIFFCYAREDKELRDELDNHLAALKHAGLIRSWYDGVIVPGDPWEEIVQDHLNRAQIILLLVSVSFLNSPFCYSIEMKQALERHHKTARVIPILLRPVDLKGTPIKKLHMLPENARPITTWPNKDEAFENVAAGIRSVIESMVAAQLSSSDVTLHEARDGVLLSESLPPLSGRQLLSPVWIWLFKRGGVYQIIIVLLILLLLVLKVVPVATSSGTKTLSIGLPGAPVSTSAVYPSERVLYSADWSKWNITNEWSLTDGILENNGGGNPNGDISFLLAPFQLQSPITNYAVETQIDTPNSSYAFGIVMGSDGRNIDGYACYLYDQYPQSFAGIYNKPNTIGYINTPLEAQVYNLDKKSHDYRVEVRNDQITFLIDKQQIVQLSGAVFLGREVGLVDSDTTIHVRSFEVTSL